MAVGKSSSTGREIRAQGTRGPRNGVGQGRRWGTGEGGVSGAVCGGWREILRVAERLDWLAAGPRPYVDSRGGLTMLVFPGA